MGVAASARYRPPAIRSRLPVRLHPGFPAIERRGLRWARAMLPFEDAAARATFLGEQHCLWTCLLFPTGEPDRVQDIADLTSLLFATDDAFVRDPAAARLVSAAAADITRGGPGLSACPWSAPLHDVWTRLRRRMPAPQLARVAAGLDALFRGAEAELALRDGGAEPPSFAAYLRLRRDSVGAGIYFVLAEYAVGADLSGVAGASAPLRSLHGTATEHLILVNDVLSFAKERAAGDAVNAVTVLQSRSGDDLDRIVTRLRAEIGRRERTFLRRQAALLRSPDGCRGDLRAAVSVLGYLLSGNLRWSYLTSRYHDA